MNETMKATMKEVMPLIQGRSTHYAWWADRGKRNSLVDTVAGNVDGVSLSPDHTMVAVVDNSKANAQIAIAKLILSKETKNDGIDGVIGNEYVAEAIPVIELPEVISPNLFCLGQAQDDSPQVVVCDHNRPGFAVYEISEQNQNTVHWRVNLSSGPHYEIAMQHATFLRAIGMSRYRLSSGIGEVGTRCGDIGNYDNSGWAYRNPFDY